MDVDIDNFDSALGMLKEHLPNASFVAIDLEMTGITGPSYTKTVAGDIPQEQYSKARKVIAQPLNIVQVGICLFEEDASVAGRFVCRPFNVYVFQRAFSERDADGNLVQSNPFLGMSASSAQFLAANGFDFQRWVTKGVSYVNAKVEAALQRAMPVRGDAQPGNAKPAQDRELVEPTNPHDIQLLEETMQKVDEFVSSGAGEMKLPSVNNFMALVFRQRIGIKYPNLVVEKRPSETNSHYQDRWLLNLSEERRKARDSGIQEQMLSHVGFRQMWNVLKAHACPKVLHNGFMDLLFLMAALEQPLPESLSELKQMVSASFHSVYDTKVLAESDEFKGRLGYRTALGELASYLAERLKDRTDEGSKSGDESVNVSFTLPDGFRQYAGNDDKQGSQCGAFHTAGYDAYETGRIFAYYRSHMDKDKLDSFRNRIFLLYSAFELRISGPDALQYDGIARHLGNVDKTMIHNRGLNELLKPLTVEGKRRAAFKWCHDGNSLLLILYGHEDTQQNHPSRPLLEETLDSLLSKQAEQGRLEWRTLESHICAAATEVSKDSGGYEDDNNGEKPAKRRRV
eukprot:TRINITY_DN23320_c0_g2_i1.p1 TRINITY_DN23320_c0_g2~~TRINITY_DN23320_c0_g2_i1.p1  ORF type:complete len:584 (+),score=64.27 TRINITY_DN23320_c0_g2_i1:45-1754(+)